MPLYGAFTALLLLISAVSAVTVPSPTNVTVSCRNLKTTVSWEYGEQQPQTRFSVNITSSAGQFIGETTEHQYDLSHFIWESEDHYTGYHSVTVTAIQGGKRSKPVQTQSLTFNEKTLAHIKCALDFPPVNLTVKDSLTTVSFYNPFHFYRELKQASTSSTDVFEFKVSSVDKQFDCGLKDIICRCDISLPEGVEECVKLRGQLSIGNRVNTVLVRETGPICPSESTEAHLITLTILLCALVLVITLVTLAICKVKAWYLKTPSETPKALVFDDVKTHLMCNPGSDKNDRIDIKIDSRRDRSSSVTSAEEDDCPTGNQDGSASSASLCLTGYMSGGLSEGSNGEMETVGLMCEGQGTDEDSANSSVDTECTSIKEEEPGSVYDRPQFMHTDIGDGDIVDCYTKR
ncbi:interferon gamma receptor 1 [Toxotes jaculatrix]|uniref:interferon gamma receptor 1 n=1 Tax=Toxotes jaculatrix TaxID=941984 RepID=UPI001B3A84D3|nr:interferon gamma receptor 1 [Toxotes jaculatrix]